VAWQQIDDETVLLDLADSKYLGANASGSVLWTALADGATRPALVERLCERFEVSPDQAGADVDAFLLSCRERGYLES
jgi:Coenzyme PQQ synthesis protein D (PqqD)